MSASRWVIVVAASPSEPGSREMLELVLAAAALEVGLAVVFRGPGVGHLEVEQFRSWRQLIDFGLAQVFVCAGDRPGLRPVGVTEIGHDEFQQLCNRSDGVLRL